MSAHENIHAGKLVERKTNVHTSFGIYIHTKMHTHQIRRINTVQLPVMEHRVKYECKHTHLGILKHAQVCIHGECSVLMATSLIEFAGLVEFSLVSVDVGLKEITVVLTSFLPLLCKRHTTTIRLAHARKSSTVKCKSSMCLCK